MLNIEGVMYTGEHTFSQMKVERQYPVFDLAVGSEPRGMEFIFGSGSILVLRRKVTGNLRLEAEHEGTDFKLVRDRWDQTQVWVGAQSRYDQPYEEIFRLGKFNDRFMQLPNGENIRDFDPRTLLERYQRGTLDQVGYLTTVHRPLNTDRYQIKVANHVSSNTVGFVNIQAHHERKKDSFQIRLGYEDQTIGRSNSRGSYIDLARVINLEG